MAERIIRYKYVRINNLDRTSGQPNDFEIDLSNEIDLHLCESVWVEMVSMPHVFNNIIDENNVLIIEYNGLQTITIPTGFYNVNQLMTEIETQINNLIGPDSVTITLDNITNKINFSFTNPLGQLFSVTSNPLSTLSPFLGITEDSPANIQNYQVNNMPNLSGPRTVFLHSKDISLSKTILSINRNVSSFASIPVTVPFGSNIVYQTKCEIDLNALQGLQDLSHLRIKVRAENGRLLELGDNHELIIVLKVFY